MSPIFSRINEAQLQKVLENCPVFPRYGQVKRVNGLMIEASGIKAEVGQLCWIQTRQKRSTEAEVVGFKENRCILMPVDGSRGIALDDHVKLSREEFRLNVSQFMLGKVLDPWGLPMNEEKLPSDEWRNLEARKLNPMKRRVIAKTLQTGIRAIDGCLTLGWGQRVGLFAGAGVGKSSLLGMLAQGSDADVNVIALIGERSREVREFLETSLSEEAMQRTVVVVATSDQPPILRIRASRVAATIAEYFRDRGNNVFFMMDSLTRFMQAHRELGLMLGEPPTSKGYTPSCFSAMAKLVERAGTGEEGSAQGDITALYTVLVEGDDMNEPVADAARSYLDGHLVLNRTLAEKGHYPAIDILQSVSRLANQLQDDEHSKAVRTLRKALALFTRMEDVVHMGAYEKGSNLQLDIVLDNLQDIEQFLVQGEGERTQFDHTRHALLQLASRLGGV